MENSSTVRPPLKRSRPQTAPMQRSPTPTMSHHSNNNNNNNNNNSSSNNNNFNDHTTSHAMENNNNNNNSYNNNNNNNHENRPPIAASSSSRRTRPQTAALTKPQPRPSFTNGPEESMYGAAVVNAQSLSSSSSRPSTATRRSRPSSSTHNNHNHNHNHGQYVGQELPDNYYQQQQQQQQQQQSFVPSGARSRPSSAIGPNPGHHQHHHNHHHNHQPPQPFTSSSLDDEHDGGHFGQGGVGMEDAKLNSLYLWDDFLHSSSSLFTPVLQASSSTEPNLQKLHSGMGTSKPIEQLTYKKFSGRTSATSKVKAKLQSRLHGGGVSTDTTPRTRHHRTSSSPVHKNNPFSSPEAQQQQQDLQHHDSAHHGRGGVGGEDCPCISSPPISYYPLRTPQFLRLFSSPLISSQKHRNFSARNRLVPSNVPR